MKVINWLPLLSSPPLPFIDMLEVEWLRVGLLLAPSALLLHESPPTLPLTVEFFAGERVIGDLSNRGSKLHRGWVAPAVPADRVRWIKC